VLAAALSISIWFIAIRSPFWLDENVSMFTIKGGFSQILSRQVLPGVPAFPVVLWLWTKLIGPSELGLRLLSILIMLGAACLLYLAARELFEPDAAFIAAIFFCLHPVIYVEAIDVRPYPFAAFAITASIFLLTRLKRDRSNWLPALFGLSAAFIVYFHDLFVVILPGLLLALVTLKADDRKTLWRQLGIAFLVFGLAFLPVIPGLLAMLHSSGTHVFDATPDLGALGQVLGPKIPVAILIIVFVIAGLTRNLDFRSRVDVRTAVVCLSLALVPALLLYGISLATPVHVFVFRYRMVAVPGVALCWAFAITRIRSRNLRLIFCLAFVAAACSHYIVTRASRLENYTWQYALAFAESNASKDHAPVLICSDLPESDDLPMPTSQGVKDNMLFPQISYYHPDITVVPLPRALNQQAMQVGGNFISEASPRGQRFLAMAYLASYSTLDWLTTRARHDYSTRDIGQFGGIKVLEFIPR
jgi:hypothetical protein